MKKSKVVKMEPRRDFSAIQENITKVKLSNKGIPEIHYTVQVENCIKTIKAGNGSVPKDSFFSAMNALKPFFCKICEIENKLDDTKIIEVSLDETGLVVTALIELTQNGIGSPVCWNSPHVFYKNKTGGFEVPKDVLKFLDEIKLQAIEYMDGDTKYKQTNMLK